METTISTKYIRVPSPGLEGCPAPSVATDSWTGSRNAVSWTGSRNVSDCSLRCNVWGQEKLECCVRQKRTSKRRVDNNFIVITIESISWKRDKRTGLVPWGHRVQYRAKDRQHWRSLVLGLTNLLRLISSQMLQ